MIKRGEIEEESPDFQNENYGFPMISKKGASQLKGEPFGELGCSYCSSILNIFVCEDCLIQTSEDFLIHKKVGTPSREKVILKLSSIKAPEPLCHEKLCSFCAESKISICQQCYFRKFEGVLVEEGILASKHFP